jgi:hypothetical protein
VVDLPSLKTKKRELAGNQEVADLIREKILQTPHKKGES